MANTALNRTGVFLGTNKSGGNLNYGDVVILDNTNNNGFTTTTTSALSTRGVGVIIEPNGIASNATGTVASSGWVPKVNLNTSATRGQFLKTHTVAGQGTPHDSPQVEGDFAVVLDITTATAPTAWLFGGPNPPAAFTSSIYINVQDQKAQNTAGGTFTSGAWQTRTLNTEVSDVGNLCSLASNQMTLSAGTYLVHATAPAYLVASRHQARLQNVTDATTLVLGTSVYAPTMSTNTTMTTSVVRGLFTVAASKAIELQHQCQTTEASDGFGVAANFTTEVYSVVELWKVG